MHYGDLTDATNLIRLVQECQPDEIYNLAAQSHVQVSFETPEYTANADALGTLRLLEAIRILGIKDKVRFYQASTSELYGKVQEIPQRETTPFYPRSPYAVAKALRLLDHGQLSRGLWHACLQRHPLQPRRAAARRDLRHAARSPARSRRIELAASKTRFTSATSTPSATGVMRATSSRACGSCCSSRSPTITCSPPAKRTRSANSWNSRSAGRTNDRLAGHRNRRGWDLPRDRQRCCPYRPALLSPDRSRRAARRPSQSPTSSSAGSHTITFPRAGGGDGGKRI